ncbi:MAG: type IV secretory system conjugative DNA transfer family protein, partial [Arenibacter sp.]|nr:type IV secretory system conjugative DNA transfer family protein [Arenibacter sp.]
MMNDLLMFKVLIYCSVIVLEYVSYKRYKQPFAFNLFIILVLGGIFLWLLDWLVFAKILLFWLLPFQIANLGFYIYYNYYLSTISHPESYRVKFNLLNGSLVLRNIRRGASIIGSAGSGKTESIVYNFLKHFNQYEFSGVIHDYKDFEITE